jgi:hypothetical protein
LQLTASSRLAALLAAVALVGCGATSKPKRLLDLQTPMYAFHIEAASCGKLRVVDGGRRLWTENGCDGATSGFVFARMVREAELGAIVKAFSALPHTMPDCSPSAPAVHIFTAREGDVQKTWRVCITDADGQVPEPFASVEAAFGAIAPPGR